MAAKKRVQNAVCLLLCGVGVLSGSPQAAPPGDLREQLQTAREYRDRGELELAIQHLEKIAGSSEESAASRKMRAEAYRELGEIWVAQKKLQEAAASVERSLALDASQAVLQYRLGIMYRQLGDGKKAVFHLELAVEGGFRNAASLFHLVQAYFAARETTAGLERARELLTMDLTSGDVPLRLGRLLFEQLSYVDALDAFRLARRKAPASYEARFFEALTLYLLDRHEEVIEVLQELKDNPGTVEVWNLLASAEAQLGRFDAATKLFEEAIEREPTSPHAYLNLALVLIEQDRHDQAESLLEQLRDLQTPQPAKVFYTVQNDSCEEITAQVEPSRAVSERDPLKAEYLYHLALTLRERHHHRTAVELLRLVRRHEGDTGRVIYSLGFSCHNLNPNSETALRLLQKAVEIDPSRHEAYSMLGRAYSKKGNPEQAVAAFRKAVELHSSFAAYFTELGRSLAARGKSEGEGVEDAIAALRRAIELDPAAALAHYELGKLLVQSGRLQEALFHFNGAIEAEPEFYEPYYQLGILHRRLKNREEASRYLELFKRKKKTADERPTVAAGFVSANE